MSVLRVWGLSQIDEARVAHLRRIDKASEKGTYGSLDYAVEYALLNLEEKVLSLPGCYESFEDFFKIWVDVDCDFDDIEQFWCKFYLEGERIDQAAFHAERRYGSDLQGLIRGAYQEACSE